ncbi:MAG: hypothetical protein ABIV28_00685 [Longimicrobiales bacterium]
MMQRLLDHRRLAAIGFLAATVASLAIAAPAAAQVPAQSTQSSGGSQFRVIVLDLANKSDPKATRFGVKASDIIRKGISQMATHTAMAAKDVDLELKKLNVLKTSFDCTVGRQLAARIGAQVTMCGDYQVDPAGGLKVSASFYTKEEAISYDVLPFTAATEVDAANRIVQEFTTYVRQLTLVSVCQTYTQSQQWQEALDKCSQALELNPRSTPSLFYRATALVNLERKEEGLAAYQKLMELAPTHQEAMYNAGVVAAQLGQTELSQKYFHNYLELNPDDNQVRATIANDLNKAGDPLGAARLLEDGLKADTANYALIRSIGDYTMVAAVKAGKAGGPAGDDAAKNEAKALYAKALLSYEKVLANLPAAKLTPRQNDDLMRYMLTAYLQTGQMNKAIALGPRAVTGDSVTSATYVVYATALGTSGSQAEAIAALDKAGRLDPTLKVSFQKALLALASGDLDAIVAFANKARAEGTSDDQIDQIAIQLVSEGSKKSGATQNAWLNAGKALAKSEKPVAMANFYQGSGLYAQGAAMIPKAPRVISKAAARQAIPLFNRAKALLQGAGAFTEAASNRAQLLNGIDKSITYLNQVIKQ